MAVPESELVDCIELAIIISEHESYFIETLFYNIADKFDDDCNSLKYKTFTDFIVLLFEYNNESVNSITSEYEFRSGVFKEIELTDKPCIRIPDRVGKYYHRNAWNKLDRFFSVGNDSHSGKSRAKRPEPNGSKGSASLFLTGQSAVFIAEVDRYTQKRTKHVAGKTRISTEKKELHRKQHA